jgi:hypothetical protein
MLLTKVAYLPRYAQVSYPKRVMLCFQSIYESDHLNLFLKMH